MISGHSYGLQLGALTALWGCAMQCGANNFACMLVGRIVAGFAIGYVRSPLYTNYFNADIALYP